LTHRTISESCEPGVRGASSRRRAGVAFAIALAGLASGCTGSLGDPDQRGFLDGYFAGSGGGEPSGAGSGGGPDAEILVAPQLAFPRLSHGQWENTVQSLFRLEEPVGLSTSFYPDTGAGSTFDNNQDAQSVTADLWLDYQRAAEEMGVMITSSDELLAKIVDPSSATSAEAFVASFGKRAYRRPLTTDETSRYLELFTTAPSVDDAGVDTFKAGVRLVIESVLQSPHFVYRVELGGEVDNAGLQPLGAWEIATKLSYTLWNDMPDDALFEAAESGKLDDAESIGVEIDRLLASDRAKGNMVSFVDQIFQAQQFESLTKSEEAFPGWDPETAADLREELARFAGKVFFDDDGGLENLLLSRTTFVNVRLARIYGLEGDFSDDEMTEVELDPDQRAGLLTLAGFLAYKGSAGGTPDSILRGVFVNRKILCTDLPDPPDEAIGSELGEEKTNREKVEALTGKGTCGEGCHSSYINPVGFALEHYDGFGRWQDTDTGEPIDAKGQFVFESGVADFDGAVQLSEAIAASTEAHACFAKHWIEFAYGREIVEDDEGLIEHIASLSLDGSSVRAVVRELLTSKPFLMKKAVNP